MADADTDGGNGMRVFMNGGGSGEKTKAACKRFNEVIDHEKPILYIPIALDESWYPGCMDFITKELADVQVPYIHMETDANIIAKSDLDAYSAVFIGGGNTFKLLKELKESGAFSTLADYLQRDGIIFGGSAGAIILGASIEVAGFEDENEVGLNDLAGFDVLSGVSLFCHYKGSEESKAYIRTLSERMPVHVLTEDTTLFLNKDKVEVIGKGYFTEV